MDDKTNSKGLPYTLNVMLTQLVSNNELQGWNIFENRHGHICMNIRFVAGEDSHVSTSVPATYRRISEKQARRNLDRAAQHNIDKQKIKTASTPKELQNNKKRKYSYSSPELIRNDIDKDDVLQFSVCSEIDTIKGKQDDSDCTIDTPKLEHNESAKDSSKALHHFSSNVHHRAEDSLPSACADILEIELPNPGTISTSQPSTLVPISCNEQLLGDDDGLANHIVQGDSHEIEEEDHFDPTYSGSTSEDSDTISGQGSSAVLCPCCDDVMTVEHECNAGTDQTDDLSASTDCSTQIQAPSQPNPDPPDRNYEGIIAVVTALTNQMRQQIRNDLFPTT